MAEINQAIEYLESPLGSADPVDYVRAYKAAAKLLRRVVTGCHEIEAICAAAAARGPYKENY